MTSTAAESVKDQELISFGFVESASVNSFADSVPSNLNEMETNEKRKKMILLIFYLSSDFLWGFLHFLVMHIIIDLGLGSFIKNQFIQLIEIDKKFFVETKPAFA